MAALAAQRLGADEAAALGPFFAAYYANVSSRDLKGADPAGLFAAALAHWRFGETRPIGTARVRAYNPNVESDGWRSPFTVIEAVTDDMPFLVDSLAAELSRQGLVAHLVVHPIVAVRRDGRRGVGVAARRPAESHPSRSFMRARSPPRPPPTGLRPQPARSPTAARSRITAARRMAEMVETAPELTATPPKRASSCAGRTTTTSARLRPRRRQARFWSRSARASLRDPSGWYSRISARRTVRRVRAFIERPGR